VPDEIFRGHGRYHHRRLIGRRAESTTSEMGGPFGRLQPSPSVTLHQTSWRSVGAGPPEDQLRPSPRRSHVRHRPLGPDMGRRTQRLAVDATGSPKFVNLLGEGLPGFEVRVSPPRGAKLLATSRKGSRRTELCIGPSDKPGLVGRSSACDVGPGTFRGAKMGSGVRVIHQRNQRRGSWYRMTSLRRVKCREGS
jgi:hypothetical protein